MLPVPLATRSLRCRSAHASVAAALVAILGLLAPAVAEARQTTERAAIDLKVRPGDLRRSAAPRPLPSVGAVPAGEPAEVDLRNPVEETDRVQRIETPNQRHGGNGIQLGGGGFLQELLEDRTIPLFRVTVEPPF